jgi:RecB family exonuclease
MTVDVAPPVELGLPVVGSLSPSRAGDFMTCPLLFRFRTIDRLPQASSPAATRGTVVHSVLERLFELPALERTPETARALLRPQWDRLLEAEPEVGELFSDETELSAWLASAEELLTGYFSLEDPRRVLVAEREQYVEVVLPGGLRLRGIVDRLDRAPSGDVRVVDYKGLALDTRLPTPGGWTTMGEVRVGDSLLGADGTPCRVVAKSSVHHRACYEVAFTDGSRLVCDNVHLWSVHVASASGPGYAEQVISTEDLAKLLTAAPAPLRGRRRPFVKATAPIELPSVELPIAPWVLGAWLGAGSSRGGQMTVGHPDRDDMLSLLKEHWNGSVSVEPASETAGALSVNLLRPRPELCPYGHDAFRRVERAGYSTRRCTAERDHRSQDRWNASLSELLSRAGLHRHKHIPARYLRASRQQRLELLQGLMDTGGSWSDVHNRAVFVTTRPALARGLRELVHSLGGTSTLSTKGDTATRAPRVVHVVDFRPNGFNPFSLPRQATKADAWLARAAAGIDAGVPHELRRTIAAVTPVDTVPTQCVEVDAADSLYLCGETLIPTHNTGRSPREAFEGKALFQMKFYALVLWRTTGAIPKLLQLMYLGDREILRYAPDERDLLAVERKLLALWEAIEKATQLRSFPPRRSKLCDWCDHQALCPEFGGTPPPFPVDAVTRLAQSAGPAVGPEPPRLGAFGSAVPTGDGRG